MSLNSLGGSLLSIFILSTSLSADSGIFKKSKSEVRLKLIDIAGKQRMLSQRVAKNYFYIANGLNTIKAKKQLKRSLVDFEKTQKRLDSAIDNREIRNLIYFVDMSLDEFKVIIQEKYSLDNGVIVLDLSESMLEGSDYIVQALSKGYKANHIVNISGKLRMLSQRIAKYYMVYQNGIKDDNTIIQMQESVKEFDKILKELIAYRGNTAKISSELKSVAQMWEVVNKFYLNIKRGGLPKIVYLTTDKITEKMDNIVYLYVNSISEAK